MWTKEDEAFMQHALDVAERGRGRVAPNPLVGCILVKEGEIIAEGWHDHLGGLHAEQMAIHDAESKGQSPNGATAYVTLEPCNHYGRTPPCTEALLWSGVKHVIVAHPDPNPTVRGKGFQVLRDAGISVESGLLEKEAAEQMKPFLHWCEHRRPIVTVKLAVDANGSVDDRSEEAQRFTSDACLDEVHRLRMDCDAILVGAETIERDNPSLTIRRVETERQPLRVILDPKERTNPNATVYIDGFDTIQVGADYNGLLPLLNRLGDMEKQRLLIEGGPRTIHSFLSEQLVDEFYLVQSNVKHHQPVPSNIDAQRLTQSGLTLEQIETWGDETVQVWKRTHSQ
jgi:diaminohydroxyphosphoribosylaminopyrimidine deaminase/5-amino-6-(5-phosphoribosylamino)uracil reductase